ncbi:poly(R)-hydroxyalkanoic acid synthase subunit PhaE [Coralloluteibacterium stylophorae]|uniref:Poly(3-hydroxyalkanoate) polymerase subunit PhaE n=2 Tax=Coralloluteibacterium stylophorae TaxID=1776034 RepID=A0AAP2CB03_9GAMM|nr:poly(R)-hydroxyalkanoic acid synthase subunit PhaE [Coralloluteibacterium stylophorae]MBS7457571.1 class III poly(R)-hydroxyalkanoic acid synthase subunit PhaE [Coralloluteibacterium stylophorae]
MGPAGEPPGDDFETLNRRMWSAWRSLLDGTATGGAGGASAQAPSPWEAMFAGWTRAAGAPADPAAPGAAQDPAQAWFARMQTLAQRFAGSDADAATVAGAWRDMLGDSPFAGLMPTPGDVRVLQDALQQILPMLGAWSGAAAPRHGFGMGREHQARWQRLAQAQADLQARAGDYGALLNEAARRAFSRFEAALGERGPAGEGIASARALFDLWIEAAEAAYAEVAEGEAFQKAQAALLDAQMRVRGGLQLEVEQVSRLLGVPTRTDVDSAYRKLTEAQRELRRLRARVEALEAQLEASAPPGPGPEPAPRRRASAVGGEAPAPPPRPRRRRSGG